MFLPLVGKSLNVTEAPWHVGIYKKDTQICGGTIVSERVVITAAHCFSESINYMHTYDVKDFQVAAGKYKRGLNEEETLETQIRDVVEVKISNK